MPFVFLPGWGRVTPFALKHAAQFRPEPPFHVKSKKYAADVHEVQALGGDGMTTPSRRTPDQTEIGLFWLESSPQSWNRLARTVSAERVLEPWENARLFALLNVAMADGYIGSWDTKYHYLFWRPVTAIRLGDTDGNPLTIGDPTWTPLQLTYPIPDYDSGHAVQGGVAAETLKRFFGTDHVGFTACSFTLPSGSTCADAARSTARIRASPRPPRRTACPGFTSAFTSGRPWRKASAMVAASPDVPSGSFSVLCTDHHGAVT